MPRRPRNIAAAHEPEKLRNRLRTALALGRQQRSEWPAHAAALAAAKKTDCAAATKPVLDMGVITAPANGMRRQRIRRTRDTMLAHGERCAVTLTFLLGSPSFFTRYERDLIDTERRSHDDLLLLRAHDGAAASAESHGGRAVAEKALAWFIYAANHTSADYVAKVDDDTLVNLPRLVGELRAVTATVPHPEHAHYGVHLFRLWDWSKQPVRQNAACGRHEDAGPPQRVERLLGKLQTAVQPGGTCEGSLGPYPFLDGSFEVLGRGVLRGVFASARVRAFAAAAFDKPQPPFWTHEDAGLGALIHREVPARARAPSVRARVCFSPRHAPLRWRRRR